MGQYLRSKTYSPFSFNIVWDGILIVRKGVYKGARFKLSVFFTRDFPKEGPKIKFVSDVVHNLVDAVTGEVNTEVK